jgi:3-oxoacyl-[acyl-carrier protein] reductase
MATTDSGGHRRLPLAWPPCQVKLHEFRRDVSLLGLEGKVTLITGAAAGIGAATAAMFAAQGATLALCDRDSAFADGDGAFRRVLDVRHGDAVSAFVAEVVESFGRIDVMINNAGGTFASPMLDVSPKGEAALIAENFTQVTHLVRQCVPHMPDGGSIVNVTGRPPGSRSMPP